MGISDPTGSEPELKICNDCQNLRATASKRSKETRQNQAKKTKPSARGNKCQHINRRCELEIEVKVGRLRSSVGHASSRYCFTIRIVFQLFQFKSTATYLTTYSKPPFALKMTYIIMSRYRPETRRDGMQHALFSQDLTRPSEMVVSARGRLPQLSDREQ